MPWRHEHDVLIVGKERIGSQPKCLRKMNNFCLWIVKQVMSLLTFIDLPFHLDIEDQVGEIDDVGFHILNLFV